MMFVRMVGPETISVVITDGGADWTACEMMIRAKWPWIFFLYCLAHGCSKVVKYMCQIPEVIKKQIIHSIMYVIYFL